MYTTTKDCHDTFQFGGKGFKLYRWGITLVFCFSQLIVHKMPCLFEPYLHRHPSEDRTRIRHPIRRTSFVDIKRSCCANNRQDITQSSTMGYDVSTGAAYAVLYTVLSLFTVLAIISAGYCGKNVFGSDLFNHII